MNLFLKFALTLLLCFAVGVSSHAVEDPAVFTVNGISYKQFEDYGYQDFVYVTPYAFGKYEGAIIIPDSVSFDGHRYKVYGIGDNSFKDCTELMSVQMDAVVVFIGNSAFENCTGLQELTVRLNTFWIAPSSMGNDLHVGYRAFYGCRLNNFTLDAHNIPPYYTQGNPSNGYTNVTDNLINNWFDSSDYWGYYFYTVFNYTSFYVPAGHGVDYKYYDNNYPYSLWGCHFGKIKEFGAEEFDNVFGMKCDTIPELVHYADSLMNMGLGASGFAQYLLMQYIDSIAQSEGKQPDYTQLEAAFDKVELENEGGTYSSNVIPEINRIMSGVYYLINQADELCDDMKEQRKQYYEAKNALEMRLKYYPNNNYEGYNADLESQKLALQSKIDEMNNKVYQAMCELAFLVDMGDSLFEKEMWDFINAFKLKASGVNPITTDVRGTRHRWYTIDGYQVDGPKKGINIVGGKKIFVR